MPDGKIIEIVATGGIDNFEVDGGVEKGCVTQVSGQHRKRMLRGLSAFFDGLESINGKGMAQAMGSGWIENDIAEFFSWLSDAQLPNGMVKEKSDLWTI